MSQREQRRETKCCTHEPARAEKGNQLPSVLESGSAGRAGHLPEPTGEGDVGGLGADRPRPQPAWGLGGGGCFQPLAFIGGVFA